MGEYYLDIETYSPQDKPDPVNDKIIVIAYQKLSTREGNPEEDLQILTEWDCGSEKAMLDRFRSIFLTRYDFDFIPIGANLYGFDLISILHRLNHHFDLNFGMDFFRTRPVMDIKFTLIMMNKGKFVGWNQLLGKKEQGKKIKEWYEKEGGKERIINYVNEEAKNFVKKYQILKKQMLKVRI